jgi:hypothetical protein
MGDEAVPPSFNCIGEAEQGELCPILAHGERRQDLPSTSVVSALLVVRRPRIRDLWLTSGSDCPAFGNDLPRAVQAEVNVASWRSWKIGHWFLLTVPFYWTEAARRPAL